MIIEDVFVKIVDRETDNPLLVCVVRDGSKKDYEVAVAWREVNRHYSLSHTVGALRAFADAIERLGEKEKAA